MADLNTPLTYQGGPAPAIPGTLGQLQTYGGTALQAVDPNMLVTNRLNTLLRSDNPLLQGARGRAMNYAAARGAGADSASYGYNAETAMGNLLTPLASEEAQTYADTYANNQDALNQRNLTRMQTNAQIASAQIGRASAMDRIRAEQQQFEQQHGWNEEDRLQNRAWDEADQDTQARASARSQFFGDMFSTIFSDPAYWRDPEAATGMMNEYGANFDQMFQNLFPEYFDTGGSP